jgi:hypothetical protein
MIGSFLLNEEESAQNEFCATGIAPERRVC